MVHGSQAACAGNTQRSALITNGLVHDDLTESHRKDFTLKRTFLLGLPPSKKIVS